MAGDNQAQAARPTAATGGVRGDRGTINSRKNRGGGIPTRGPGPDMPGCPQSVPCKGGKRSCGAVPHPFTTVYSFSSASRYTWDVVLQGSLEPAVACSTWGQVLCSCLVAFSRSTFTLRIGRCLSKRSGHQVRARKGAKTQPFTGFC